MRESVRYREAIIENGHVDADQKVSHIERTILGVIGPDHFEDRCPLGDPQPARFRRWSRWAVPPGNAHSWPTCPTRPDYAAASNAETYPNGCASPPHNGLRNPIAPHSPRGGTIRYPTEPRPRNRLGNLTMTSNPPARSRSRTPAENKHRPHHSRAGPTGPAARPATANPDDTAASAPSSPATPWPPWPAPPPNP